jgi:RNA polymerase sigma factor for flagellar operon FliA
MAISNSSGKTSFSAKNEPWHTLENGGTAWVDFSHQDQEKIVRHFAPKVKFLALRLKARLPRNIELNELISAGTLGLVEALGKFQPQLNIKFDTYAENRIRGAMLDELRRMDWFPRSLRRHVRQVDEAVNRLEGELGRMPTENELAKVTGLETKEVREALEAMQNQLCLSLDAMQDGLSIAEDAFGNQPYHDTAKIEIINHVASLIEQLTPREKLVLSLYYTDELNMREVADVMSITEGRVSQLHSQALTRLRKEFRARHGDMDAE